MLEIILESSPSIYKGVKILRRERLFNCYTGCYITGKREIIELLYRLLYYLKGEITFTCYTYAAITLDRCITGQIYRRYQGSYNIGQIYMYAYTL